MCRHLGIRCVGSVVDMISMNLQLVIISIVNNIVTTVNICIYIYISYIVNNLTIQ